MVNPISYESKGNERKDLIIKQTTVLRKPVKDREKVPNVVTS